MVRTEAAILLLALLLPGNGVGGDWPSSLDQALQEYEAADAEAFGQQPDGILHYSYAQADLNGDPWPDAVVMLLPPGYCGTGGCTLLLLAGTEDGFKVVDRSALVREPIELSDDWRDGWRTLVVGRGGGGVPYGIALTWFADGEYTGGLVEEDDPRVAALGRRQVLQLIEVDRR